MLPLKNYQQRALESLKDYFIEARKLNDANLAFYQITRKTMGRGIPYQEASGFPGMPYVCLRMPTGGGKTLVASHAIGIAARDFLFSDHALVLWLTPSNAIRDQTFRALSNREHPYRQALESTCGSITVLSVSEALEVQSSTLNSSTTIIVSTIQAFRVDNTEGRKVYEDSGALMNHFSNIPDELKDGLEKTFFGRPKYSLANVLAMHRPIVIVDEAHNARTPLSFDTLSRFKPSCVLEFTATPRVGSNSQDDPNSNVIHATSAAELKAESMIKMPIRLKVQADWKQVLSDAVIMRSRLESAAKLEKRKTGEYLRPILLLQAQARSQTKDTITVDTVRQTLIDDFNIPNDQIARATGEIDEISNMDLSNSGCPIRFIITVQALREGWDCPFAYVLCSLIDSKSNTAIEQIIGRVMRMPAAKHKETELLNMAYAFSSSENFGEVAKQLTDSLVKNGFEPFEAQKMIQPASIVTQLPLLQFDNNINEFKQVRIDLSGNPDFSDLPAETLEKVSYDDSSKTLTVNSPLEKEEADLLADYISVYSGQSIHEELESAIVYSKSFITEPAPSERGEKIEVPQLMVKMGNQLELFEETVFLSHPWNLAHCNCELQVSDYTGTHSNGTQIEFDVDQAGGIQRTVVDSFIYSLQETMFIFNQGIEWNETNLVSWLDRTIYHPDIPSRDSIAFLAGLVTHLISQREFTLAELVQNKYRLREAVENKINEHRQAAREQAYKLLLFDDCQTPLVIDENYNFKYNPSSYPYSKALKTKFSKHYYPEVGDLEEQGEEFSCAVFLNSLPEVKVWVRNLERKPSDSFWLQTSTDRFYPDFVCQLVDGRILVVEYKGEDRWSNADSLEKRTIGNIWQERSQGKCIFVMPNGQDWQAIRAAIQKK